jgi:hypothetical protein
MSIKELQEKLVGIISLLIIEDDEKEINDMKKQAFEIINNEDFKAHINDNINGETILDNVKKCSVRVGQNYTEKRGLLEIEKAIEDVGGKTSEELGRNATPSTRLEEVTNIEPVQNQQRQMSA